MRPSVIKRVKARKEKQVCIQCGKPLDPTSVRYCSKHKKDRRTSANGSRWKRLTNGLCAFCKELAVPNKTCCERHLAELRARQKAWQQKTKALALNHYGGRCVCCGESNPAFLEFDHINNDGAEHRKKDKAAAHLASWLVRNGFPDTFQVLCGNCNRAKHRYGVCPHQTMYYPS